MYRQNGPPKGRPGKAAAAAGDLDSTNVTVRPSSVSQRSKVADHNAAAEALAPSDDFIFIQAILGTKNNARLATVQRMLKSVVAAAGGVVRGTDSQRKFTVAYTEFCASAVRCLADVEEAVYELTHPGCRAADAADTAVEGIADAAFLKQVAAYMATHTSALSLTYLEHVGLSAVEKQHQQQRKRERDMESASRRTAKVGRTAGRKDNAIRHGLITSGGGSVDDAFDSLGLVDSSETAQQALQAIQRERRQASATALSSHGSATGAVSYRVAAASATAQIGLNSHAAHASGVFVRKGSAAASSGFRALVHEQDVSELRNPNVQLSNIPELAPLLQPWMFQLPSGGGIYLERVTIERDRRGGAGSSVTASSTTLTESVKPVLEVCLAASPSELLQRWESREVALASQQPSPLTAGSTSSPDPFSVVPSDGTKRGGGSSAGGSPRGSTSLGTPPLSALSGTDAHRLNTHVPPEVEAGVSDGDGGILSTPSSSAFFPAVRHATAATRTCLLPFLTANLSHYGLSKMDFVYTMGPAAPS